MKFISSYAQVPKDLCIFYFFDKIIVRFYIFASLISKGGDDVPDFEQIYNMYFKDVYLYIRRLSGNEHIAEEITSDTFFKAMRSIDKFRGECDIRVWLCQIAKNCYYSYIKKKGNDASSLDDEMGDIPDRSLDLAEDYAAKEEASRIQKILHDIGEPYKEVFMWRVYAEMSFKDIAKIFGKTENWACVTYHRARKMIKERLEEKHHEK